MLDTSPPAHDVGAAAALAEPARLAALARSGVMVGGPDEPYARPCRIAARALQTPVARVTFIAADHQVVRGAVGDGLPAGHRSSPPTPSFCRHVVVTGAPLAVDDVYRLPHPLARHAPPDVRAYLGVPIRSADGLVLGALCVADRVSRRWTPDDCEALLDVAALVSSPAAPSVSTHGLDGQAVLRSEARFQGLVDAVPDLFLRLSRDGRYLDVQAPDPSALLYDEARVLGWTVGDSIEEPLASVVLGAIGRALDTGGRERIEYALTHADGRERQYEARLVPVGRDEVQAIIRDVTDEEVATRTLRQSEVLFRSFVEATTQVVWRANTAGEVTELSEAWAQFTGQAPEEIAGWGWADALHPDDTPRVVAEWSEAIEQRALYEVEYRVRSREGPYHWFSVRAVPVSDGDAFLGWVGTCTDVEAAHRHEAELVEAARVAERGRAEAEEAARMKSALLANLSHEIRTPLTSIIGFADILSEEPAHRLRREREEYARLIGRGGRRLLETLTSVLDLAQIEAGRRPLHPARVDVGRVVRDTADLLRPHAEAKRLAFGCHLPEAPVVVWTDAGALSRILTNLLSNAVKFTPAGAVRVELIAEADRVTIRVADTGVGMSEAFLPIVFDDFRQESEGHTRRFEGSGLGLAITRRLVEMLGGTVTAESRRGAGSTFTVRLPRRAGP